MGRIEVWILENAVTIVATLYLALINGTRLSRAYLKLDLPGSYELKVLRFHNYRRAQDEFYLNMFILGLGIGMVVWAMRWDEGPVPLGIVIGTGLFTLGWVGWSYRGWQGWQRLTELTRLAEVRSVTTSIGRELVAGRVGSPGGQGPRD